MVKFSRRALHAWRSFMCCLLFAVVQTVPAETLLRVDAVAQISAPVSGYLQLGTTTSPSGATLGVNSLYLTRNGAPWLPVMGEFHYTRFPRQYWEEELLKMKAAGVDIVATYVVWNHHEERPGEFNWSGDRDLRHFLELCAQHGLYALVRLGPWTHGEARFGGTPDWVVAAMPTRGNDPTYLKFVNRYWTSLAAQLHNLLWKDGGPVIGVQLENEYNLSGPGRGPAHIATLKEMAVGLGIDVPFYTVTGWDGALYPPSQVVPVFAGYPDEPWATSTAELPPEEVYQFRFESRVAGNAGAQTPATAQGTWFEDRDKTPFLGAEFGGGVPSMYRRRSVIAPDDIGAMLPVQLGSGANLYGYYMFQGGRNPVGGTTLEESTLTGGYNDTPIVGYDFQAPLGQYGDQHPVMSRLRRVHAFVRSFGPLLAPMPAHRPERVPASRDDLSTLRYSVRSRGDAGFLFVNNYVRQYPMAPHRDVRFSVALPAGELTFPQHPLDIPSGAYFIWPLNLDMEGAKLTYATAQPITVLSQGKERIYLFFAQDGIPVEFCFDAASVSRLSARGQSRQVSAAGHIVVSAIRPGTEAAISLETRQGVPVRIVVLSEAQSRDAWVIDSNQGRRMLLSRSQLFGEGNNMTLRSIGQNDFRIGILPALPGNHTPNALLRRQRDAGVFQIFSGTLPLQVPQVEVKPLRQAGPVPPLKTGGAANAALQPAPETFGASAAWTISVSPATLTNLSDAYLDIDYRGDVGRLFADTVLLDDHYYNGVPWRIGLKRFAAVLNRPLVLTVLPLRGDANIYLDASVRSRIAPSAQIAEISSVRVLPEYEVGLDLQ